MIRFFELPPVADKIELTSEVYSLEPALAGFCVGSILRANTDPGTDLEALIRPAAEVAFTHESFPDSALGVFLKSVVIAPAIGDRHE